MSSWARDGQLRIVEVADVGEDAILVHDAERDDPSLAFALARLSTDDHSPTPIGVFRAVDRPEYGTGISQQLMAAAERKGPGDLARAAALQRHLVRQLTSGTVTSGAEVADQSSERRTRPVRSFGVKNVDFGGMSAPSLAVRSISATLTGRTRTAAWASPAARAAITDANPGS